MTFSTLANLGWNDLFESLFVSHGQLGLDPGRVTRADRGLVTVDTGSAVLRATPAGRLDSASPGSQPAVGDWVALDLATEPILVRAILDRSSTLARQSAGAASRQQIVAANVDLVLVVEPLDRGPNLRRIERAVALAFDGGATPLVVLTKADLSAAVDEAQERARSAAPFVDVVTVSATQPEGLLALAAHLTSGTTAVLLGPSGAGKSTLVNRLLGEERFETAAVRAGDHKGRHTTTSRELVRLESGACLIDTPGIRELGLWLAAEAVDRAFPDIEELGPECRYRDCRHQQEPGCAVQAAVAAGLISQERLASFHRLGREAEALELRVDPRRRHEARARERSFGKMVRTAMRVKAGRANAPDD